jgi:hypothetical protein
MEQFRNWAWRPRRAALQIEEENQMRNQRSGIAAPRSYNRYPVAPDADGRGASTVTRAKPHGKDPLAVETREPSTQPRRDKEHT